LKATDKPGAMAAITKILADIKISIDAMIQKEPATGTNEADIVILTHKTVEKNMNQAIKEIEALPAVVGDIVKIRMETLGK
jgi:homoserine dehydrogenase